MKKFFRSIHLYLSLAAGLVIMVTCLTGAILVFEHELQALFNPARYRVEATGNRLPLQQLVNNVEKDIPKAKINSVKVYSDSTRTVEIAYAPKKDERRTAFVNPYSGEIVEHYNYRETFFYWVMDVHRWMLGGDIGKLVVGISTLIFLFILITGAILWWPKSKNMLKARMKLRLDAGWKRINHDLHIVLGFYSLIFLFILAFTGLAWSFEWFNKGIYTVTGSSMKPAAPPEIAFNSSTKPIDFDQAFLAINYQVPGARFYNISSPKDSLSPYTVNLLKEDAVHESATDSYYVDPFTGKIAGTMKWDERNTGQRVRSTFKPVHIASIFGLPSKIIGLVVCLFGASFPITGLIMWINRLKKNKAK